VSGSVGSHPIGSSRVPPPAPPPPPTPRRGLVAAATVFGAFGVASLPLALAYPSEFGVYVLALAGPIGVALAGEALHLRWLRTLGMGVAVVAAVSPVVGLGLLLASLIVLGPLGVVTAVGAAIRAIDPTAGTAFLSACAIAIAGGFAGGVVSPPIVVGVTVLVMVGGTATTLSRLADLGDA
jgi:hypothetical protein